jgi:methylated-DNA-[protein]-cysteine S-methyltransferase
MGPCAIERERAQVQPDEAAPPPQGAPSDERGFAASADLERAGGSGGREPKASGPPSRSPARLRYPSPLGALCIEASDAGVFGLSFDDRGPSRPGVSARARAHLDDGARALDAYFAGRPSPPPSLDLRGTPFQRAVWDALVRIPWGELRSYGEIARLLGRAGCARAVGGANHENPIAILVPCHRVVQASGRLGGYAAGLDAKRWLLAHEAAHAPALRRP